jgi:hypothetical protein
MQRNMLPSNEARSAGEPSNELVYESAWRDL